MKYGIQTKDSGRDYTVFGTLKECADWLRFYMAEIENDEYAKYVKITDADNPRSIIFYKNIKRENGQSNCAEIIGDIETME